MPKLINLCTDKYVSKCREGESGWEKENKAKKRGNEGKSEQVDDVVSERAKERGATVRHSQ